VVALCPYHGPVARDRLLNTLDARPRRAVLRPCYGCLLDWCLSLLPNVRPVQPIDELPARRVGGPKAPTKPPSLVPCTRIKRLAPVENSVVVEQEQLSGSQVDRIRTRVHILKPLRELGPGTHCRVHKALPFPRGVFKLFLKCGKEVPAASLGRWRPQGVASLCPGLSPYAPLGLGEDDPIAQGISLGS
jgi:hypothetical protein